MQIRGRPDPYIILAFSGGGMRAAAFAQGALWELSRWKLGSQSLLDHVAVVSSVSGGSFTAAHFACFGADGFDRFEAKFLSRNIPFSGLLPFSFRGDNIWKLVTRRWGPLLADYLHQELFSECRFGDLRSYPRLVINATDLVLGRQFSFTSRYFEPIGRDLSSERLADAVAASAAFPVLLSPITLRNVGWNNRKEPQWVTNAEGDVHRNLTRFRAAQAWRTYANAKSYPYVHLADGGLSDNSGAYSIAESFADADVPPTLLDMISQCPPRHLAVFGINAKTRPLMSSAKRPQPPHAVKVLLTAATSSMDLRTDDSIQQVEVVLQNYAGQKNLADKWDPVEGVSPPDGGYVPIVTKDWSAYVGHVSFDSEQDAIAQHRLFAVGTNLSLDRFTVRHVHNAGARLLGEHPSFRRFVKDINGTRQP